MFLSVWMANDSSHVLGSTARDPRRRPRGHGRVRGGCVCVALMLAVPVGYADTSPSNQPTQSDALQEVVVTAQKVAQDIIKVPVSISVLSGTTLRDEHILDYQDITREVPGLAFNAGNTVSGGTVGPGTSNLVIRGVSSASGSATVGLYIDDVSITESNLYDGAAEPKFVDFDRIEVLRGPQGTLFGASSMGGTIRFISDQPVYDQFSADLDSDLSTTRHGGTNYVDTAAVNIPIVSDTLAARVAFEGGGNSGYIDHYDLDGNLTQAGTNTESWYVLHATAKYRANDDLTVTLGTFAQSDFTGDTPVFYPELGTYNQDKQVKEPSNDNLLVQSLTLDQHFAAFDLTAITGYFYRDFRFQSDGTYFNDTNLALYVLDPAYPAQAAEDDAIIGNLPSYVHRENLTYQISQEIRASSQTSSLFGHTLSWLGGVYVESQRQVRRDIQYSPGLQADFYDIYGFSINDSVIGPSQFPANDNVTYADDLIYFDQQHITQDQYAAFGQVEYSITPALRAALGLRELYATVDYSRDSGGFYEGGTTLNPFFVSTHNDATTPKLSLTYDVTATDSVYASATKGFRLGGPTGPVTSELCTQELQSSFGISKPPFSYTPDSLWSYELGSKNLVLDNRVSIDGDVFYVDWHNIQQSVNLPICGASITLNVGAAETYGAEMQMRAKLFGGLNASVVGGITRASITASPNYQTDTPGEWLLNVPRWSLTPALEYDWPVGAARSMFVRADYDMVGQSHGAFSTTDPAYDQPGYNVLNGSVGFASGALTVSLYAKNVLDNANIIARPSINFVEEGYTLRPFTVGLMGSMKF
ncbi:MAG TPA: TonB-dependent receptor [Steroidobacteraceae bacterium]|nr:TonB-dependent receptor [Steroidobacteraceae bacterium]